MIRYLLRILRSDWRSWLPLIAVVAVISTLIGACINQFAWTNTEAFVSAATAAGLDPAEFGLVSLTIYLFVALLTVFALTVVGGATVDRVRDALARWRLMGASPRQVRGAVWALVGVASTAGALPGAVLSIGASAIAVPVFNRLAAQGFPGGAAHFDAPPFVPSMWAWPAALLVAVATCLAGAVGPAHRAARVEPVEAIRHPGDTNRRRRWPRWLLGAALGAAAAAVALGSASVQAGAEFGVGVAAMVNGAMGAGVVAALAAYVLGPALLGGALGLIGLVLRWLPLPVSRLAARSARASAGGNAHTVAPLAAAIGLAAVMVTVRQSLALTIYAAGFDLGEHNYVDVLVLAGLFASVALLTSLAVIALTGHDAGREVATLRLAGATPAQVGGMLAAQSGALAICAVALALLPLGVASLVVAGGTAALVGAPIVVVPWTWIVVAGVACFAVLLGGQWLRLGPALKRDAAVALRAA